MLLPAGTGLGEAVFDRLRSYWPDVPTVTLAVAEFVSGFGSVTLELTFAVSEITVPEGVVLSVLSFSVKLAVEPEVKAALEQVVPVPGQQEIVPVPPDAGSTGQIQPV